MTKRSPLTVFLLALVTLGIYSWYWSVKTKTELNQRGATIPTAWIWLIPFVGGIYWIVKYVQGVETVSGGKMSALAAFLWLFLLGPIGEAILQGTFNEVQ